MKSSRVADAILLSIVISCVYSAANSQTPKERPSILDGNPNTDGAATAIAKPPKHVVRPKDPDQTGCDGYGQMLDKGDGLNTTAVGWYAGGNRLRGRPYSTGGVAACDRAIETQTNWYPQHWRRKVSLFQSRALHNIHFGDLKAAAGDIVAADAAVIEFDPFHNRSQRLNTRFIEAYLLMEMGDRQAGQEAALLAWRTRPYARQSVDMALAAIGPDGDNHNILTLLKAKGRLDPNKSALPFLYEFENGRFAEALEFADEIVPIRSTPPDRDSFEKMMFYEENIPLNDIKFWVEILGRKAYALQALGQSAAADTVLSDLEHRFSTSSLPPLTLPKKPTRLETMRAATRNRINSEISSAIPGSIEDWRSIVLARRLALEKAGTRQEKTGRFPFQLKAMGYASIELAAASAGKPAERITPTQIHRFLALPEHSVEDMFSILLDGEIVKRVHPVPSLENEKFNWSECGEYINKKPNVFCHRTRDATLATTEEWALLKAAVSAQKKGSAYFSISRRIDIQHSIIYSANYMPSGPMPFGFSTQITISDRPGIQPDNVCWRCISPNEIEDSLKPIYVQKPGVR